MKESGKQQKCQLHSLPILKIELTSHKLLCERCISQTEQQRRQRLQLQRLKVHKSYQIALEEIRSVKEGTDKLVELFQSKSMSQAKKVINKSSAQVQKVVENLLQRQLKEANKTLKQAGQKQLQQWKMIDGRSFCSSYIQFEDQHPKIQQRLNHLKQTLKQEISDKLKLEIRGFYNSLFQF